MLVNKQDIIIEKSLFDLSVLLEDLIAKRDSAKSGSYAKKKYRKRCQDVETAVRSLTSAREHLSEPSRGEYDVWWDDGDNGTQFNAEDIQDLAIIWYQFCKDEGLDPFMEDVGFERNGDYEGGDSDE